MALLAIYSLLLLCSLSPLLYATHDGVCPEGSYCPAGIDCSNSSFCRAGVCNAMYTASCIEDVSLAFASSAYTVDEDAEKVQIELTLDGPIDCCSISVTVKVEDLTATGGKDYVIPRNQYISVKFAAGQTSALFDVNIIDDEEIEDTETFLVSIFELSVPFGVTLGITTSAEVSITDNDDTTLSFSKATYNVKENEGPAEIELTLSVPAPDNITVQISSTNIDLAEECDQFSETTYDVIFPNGTTTVTFFINITNDDIYEGDESFTLQIQDSLPTLVTLGEPNIATVVIQEDEDKIVASFKENVYSVPEHQGILAPVIELSKPSPCCFILHAQLMNITAQGRTVDYGYASPKIYNYTFYAGSTCASPDANITITDDLIAEKEEAFKISIIEGTLPFGVEAGGPATVIINDNDNSVFFEYEDYNVSEVVSRRYIKLLLRDPAASELIIPVYTYDTSATGEVDYESGVYNVTFEKGDTYKYFYVSIIDDNIYEGDETFYVSLEVEAMPLGVVPASPSTATINIQDDEFVCCFKPTYFDVKEGSNVEVYITCSNPLLTSLTVRLQYFDVSADKRTDYYASPTSVRIAAGNDRAKVVIRTRQDSYLEDKYEYFDVKIDYLSKPNNSFCDDLAVTIEDDDDATIKFERNEYRAAESSLVRPRLALSKTPTTTFTVNIEEDDEEGGCCSNARGGDDYKRQRYDTVRFIKGGSRFVELKTEFIKDKIVEDDECYYLRIVPDTLPDRIIAGNPNYTKIVIQNDDVCTVTLVGNRLKFSEEIYADVELEISYYEGNPRVVEDTLAAGNTEIILDASRINRLQRITIYPDCCLDSNDFRIRASRTYLSFRDC